MIAVLFVLSSVSAFANVTAVCRPLQGKAGGDTILEDIQKFGVSISNDKVVLSVSPKMRYVGNFEKLTKTGSYLYQSDDVMNEVDQADHGYIIVSPALQKGHNGRLAISVRQVGDSEGAWWITQSFGCTVR